MSRPIDFARIRSLLPSLEQVIRDCGLTLRKQGSHWFARCPFHDDSSPSFSIFPDGTRCGCPPCQWDGDVFEFVQRFYGLANAIQAAQWLCERYGIAISEPAKRTTRRGPYVEHYDYTDAAGTPVYRITRYHLVYADDGSIAGKTFSQGRLIDGVLQGSMDDVEYVLFRLPEVLAADVVYLCEGERDALAVVAAGGCGTCDAGGCGSYRKFAERSYPKTLRGKDVLVIPDTDKVGKERGSAIAAALYGIANRVRIVDLPDSCKDIRDYLEAGGALADLDRMFREFTPPPVDEPAAAKPTPGSNGTRPKRPAVAVAGGTDSGWTGAWPSMKSNGMSPQPVLANAIYALRTAPEFAGRLHYDEFGIQVVARGAMPWGGSDADITWTDQEERLLCEWLQHRGLMVGTDIVGQAVETVAREHTFHPVRDYLEFVRWDGDPRLDTWLTEYLGVPPSNYAAAVGAKWMISAVARVFNVGCKADYALILEGPQGIRKSTAINTLADPWFSDDMPEIGEGKESAISIAGVWIMELAELSSMCGPRVNMDKVKAFMSRKTDRFRPPYGKRAQEFPRQCIFAGTTNNLEYLSDSTGARRFWPVVASRIDIERLRRDRDQLWAEAVVRFRDGEAWYLDDPSVILEAEEHQADRYTADAWEGLIAGWCKFPMRRFHPQDPSLSSTRESILVEDVLKFCIGKEEKHWSQGDRMRIARILGRCGYRRRRIRNDDGGREYRYEVG